MESRDLIKSAEPKNLGDFLADMPEQHDHGHDAHGGVSTMREDDYKGHHIVIMTTYNIEVDGKPFQAPIGLTNDGQLHVHSLPNYQFSSAVELMRRLIDVFPKDFPKPQGGAQHPGGPGGHGGHGGDGGDGGDSGGPTGPGEPGGQGGHMGHGGHGMDARPGEGER